MLPARSRMFLLVIPALLMTLLATVVSTAVVEPPSFLAATVVASLLAVGFGRMALTASGFLLGLGAARDDVAPHAGAGTARTALLVPIHNEAPAQIAAAVDVMAGALRQADGIAIFILSDTQDERLIAAEAEQFKPHGTTRSGIAVHYRRRTSNTGRKAGNIGEFCRHAGRAYDFAIVLDADSLMTGDAIRRLVASMRAAPRMALIQSVTYPAGGRTLFGRMQQFAARLNTPLAVAGQHAWQGPRGTFWGHNAILRLAPFTAHAVLPVLPGRPPMGGEVLCHDTIEAALLLRAGWEVGMAPAIAGSYETTPSNLVDHLARERRWCQGNLQHLRLIGADRFVPESRLHILIGILHYLSAPAALALGVLLLSGAGTGPHRLPAPLVAASAWLTLLLLFGPRLASLARALGVPGAAAGFGGRARLVASALAEQVATTLTAPIFMVSVSGFVLATFTGRVVRWDSPVRGDRKLTWREAWRHFRWHTAIGIGAVLAAWSWHAASLPYLAPFVAGLVLSVPLAVGSGSVRLGALARRLGLFLTEDERTPPAELAALLAGAPAARGRQGFEAAAE